MHADEYMALSKSTGDQMGRISKSGAKLERAIRRSSQSGGDQRLISSAIRAAQKIGGSPGDGAIEIYRDLEMNLRVADEFLSEWGSNTRDKIVVEFAALKRELQKLQDLVADAGPERMVELKEHILNTRSTTEADIYDFKGSNLVAILAFLSIAGLRYFDVITWSWYVTIPVGIAAMVFIPALVSTIIRLR